MRKWAIGIIVCSVIQAISPSTNALGATFYVSGATGSDTGAGDSSHPWQTIAKACAAVHAGDEVVIGDGTYLANSFNFTPAGANSGKMTVFHAAAGARPLLTRSDGKPPAVGMSDYVRIEGLWIGGAYTKDGTGGLFQPGGSPLGHGRQIVNNTIFGYQTGIAVGCNTDLLVQGNRIIDTGNGRFDHATYLSGGYTPGSMTTQVIMDNNVVIGGEGYALHEWHYPKTTIWTRNFASDHFWGMTTDGNDHLFANNVLWNFTGQPGREPGWDVWLNGSRTIFANNILGNSGIGIFETDPKVTALNTFSNNAYVRTAPFYADQHPIDWRGQHDDWAAQIDQAVANIKNLFLNNSINTVMQNADLENWFATLKEAPLATGMDLGLQPDGQTPLVGRDITIADFWAAYDSLGLKHYDSYGNIVPEPSCLLLLGAVALLRRRRRGA